MLQAHISRVPKGVPTASITPQLRRFEITLCDMKGNDARHELLLPRTRRAFGIWERLRQKNHALG